MEDPVYAPSPDAVSQPRDQGHGLKWRDRLRLSANVLWDGGLRATVPPRPALNRVFFRLVPRAAPCGRATASGESFSSLSSRISGRGTSVARILSEREPQTIVQAANGNVYRVSENRTQAVKPGEKITKGERIRTAKNAGAVIKLADGSFVDHPVAQRARDILRAGDH